MSQLSTARGRSSLAIAFECAALDPIVISLDIDEATDVIEQTPAGRESDPRDDAAPSAR